MPWFRVASTVAYLNEYSKVLALNSIFDAAAKF